MRKKSQIYNLNQHYWLSSPNVSEYRSILNQANKEKKIKYVTKGHVLVGIFPDHYTFTGCITKIYTTRHALQVNVEFIDNNSVVEFSPLTAISFMNSVFEGIEIGYLQCKNGKLFGDFALKGKKLMVNHQSVYGF